MEKEQSSVAAGRGHARLRTVVSTDTKGALGLLVDAGRDVDVSPTGSTDPATPTGTLAAVVQNAESSPLSTPVLSFDFNYMIAPMYAWGHFLLEKLLPARRPLLGFFNAIAVCTFLAKYGQVLGVLPDLRKGSQA
ncbi:hypothetical protein K488DRAFT_92391 [Vararia minispora EC-137]|uniref:Uncharacterized protein n=1 Tax=Vararia minispora EC-137 TaxID=1314806 RepID=A0ACB8Q4D2_9AGAM|nr:hypothetical protein K488DRAFT_92391 [Vararia minispora EC-137]